MTEDLTKAPPVSGPKAPSPAPSAGAAMNAPDPSASLEMGGKFINIVKVVFNPLSAPKALMELSEVTGGPTLPCMKTATGVFEGVGKMFLNPIKGGASMIGKTAMGDGPAGDVAAVPGKAVDALGKGAEMASHGATALGGALQSAGTAIQGATDGAAAGIKSGGAAANAIPVAGQVICVAATVGATTVKVTGTATALSAKGLGIAAKATGTAMKVTGKVLKGLGKVMKALEKSTGKAIKIVRKVSKGAKKTLKAVKRGTKVISTPVRMGVGAGKGALHAGKGVVKLADAQAHAAEGDMGSATRALKAGVSQMAGGLKATALNPIREARVGIGASRGSGGPAKTRIGLAAKAKIEGAKASFYQKLAGEGKGARGWLFKHRAEAAQQKATLATQKVRLLQRTGQFRLNDKQHARFAKQMQATEPKKRFILARGASRLASRVGTGAAKAAAAKPSQILDGFESLDGAQEQAGKGDLQGAANQALQAGKHMAKPNIQTGLSRTLGEVRAERADARQKLRQQASQKSQSANPLSRGDR